MATASQEAKLGQQLHLTPHIQLAVAEGGAGSWPECLEGLSGSGNPVMQLFGCLYKTRLVCFLKDFLRITHQTRAIQQALVFMDLGAEPG